MDDDIREHLSRNRFREAFELLLECYQHKVFRLAWSLLGDESAAEEMAQEVFIQIWKGLPFYRGGASISTWIYAITRNRSLTRRKKLYKEETLPLQEPSPRSPRPERAAAMDARELLAELPPQYRQAVILFYLEEKSYEEVSALLGLPVGTVKTYLHRARKQLAQSMGKRK